MSSTPTALSDQSSSQYRPQSFKNPSNLYLITFLATLFLLLLISATIVLRSFLLRRRFQRHLDEAFAAGIILAPRTQGSHRRRYGHKPKMHTSWLVHGGENWTDIMPVSALPMQVKRRCKSPHSSSSKHDQQPISSVPPTDHDSFGWRLFHGAPRDPTVSEKPLTVRADRLQVSVLIAMPAQHKPMNHSSFSLEKDSDNEDLIPDVVFGITRLPYKPPNQIP